MGQRVSALLPAEPLGNGVLVMLKCASENLDIRSVDQAHNALFGGA
jgi:hypothetical protein